MAKKKRHRVWYCALFEEELKRLQQERILGNEERDEWPILFDRKEDAYAIAYANRFETIRENGEVVTNDQGHAKLKSHGRIYLLAINGKRLDWKQVSTMKPSPYMKGDAIAVTYELSLHKQNIVAIYPEKLSLFEQAMTSPIAKAGGIVYEPEPSDVASEEHPAQVTQ